MKDLPTPVEPIVVTTVFSEERGVEKYKNVPVEELVKGSLEETIWLLWTGKKPNKVQTDLVRMILIMIADHGPEVAGAYSTILATSAGLYLPQAVAAGVQMIGPRFGGAAGMAALGFKTAVDNNFSVAQFEDWAKSAKGWHTFPGIGHKVFSRTKPDTRVANLVKFAKKSIKRSGDGGQRAESGTPHLDFALELEKVTLIKNEKLILNIDGAIGAVLMDVGFPLEGVDGFFVLGRTIGLIAHFIDQKQRGTGLIRFPENLVLHK